MEIKKLITELSFTKYDSQVYLTLLNLGPSPARTISKRTGIAKNKVYESLIRLAERGYIGSLDLTPRIYKIINTEKLQQDIEEKQETISKMQIAVNKLQEMIKHGIKNEQDIATVMKGKDQIIRMLQFASEKSQKYIYSFSGGFNYHPRSARLVKSAIRRGVDVRFLIHKVKGRENIIKKWKDLGAKVRFFPKDEQRSIRFSSMDEKLGRITIGRPQISDYEDYLSFWIESPAFSVMLKEHFLEKWKQSKDA